MRKATQWGRKILMCTLTASMVITGVNLGSLTSAKAANYNYGDALSKSLLFYQLQESGKLSDETLSRTNWRGDSCIHDGSDYNLDLTGGWYDAGDNVKFNLPMSYSSMILGWSYLNNQDAYDKSGQAKWILHDIEWANDYFVKCNPDANTYFYQVGDGNADHAFWGAPELVEAKMEHPAYKVDATSANGGSCVTGEAAASLAVAYLCVKDTDPQKAAIYLNHAKVLYSMAERAKSDAGYTAASGFYNSWSGFYDELSLAACWLYKATGDKTYLTKAINYSKEFGAEFQGGTEHAYSWTMSWDDVHMAAEIMLAELTGDRAYYKVVENSIDCWNGKLEGSNPITITSGGLSFLSGWGSIRYACNQAFINVLYAGLPEADSKHVTEGLAYVERTVNYVLGSSGQNFMVGYNAQSPKNPHHRAAHGSWNNSLTAEPAQSRHTLVGAVVGGPGSASDSSYEDDRGNYQTNEVACDYNAGFTGACAYMYAKNGYGAVKDATAIETPDGKEYLINAGINCQDSQNATNFVELKVVVNNHTAWPARVSENLKLRAYFDLTGISDPSAMKISTTYQQYPIKISAMKPTAVKNIYYVDLDMTGAKIFPGGQSESKCEIQFRVAAPGKWDYSNSPCLKGIGGTSNNEMKVPTGMVLYDNGKVVCGKEYDGSEIVVPVDPVDPVNPVDPVDPIIPIDPTPVDPTPVDPTPVDPTPVDPTPVDPTPVDPTPVDPTPVDPTPVDPTPVDPTPVDPTPVDPTPVDPTPVDPTPVVSTGLTAGYTINNWGSGYQALIDVKNTSTKRVDTWKLLVNKNDIQIDSSWNVNIKDEGNYYAITPMEWNSVIEPGNAVNFGVQGSGHIGTTIEILVDGQSADPAPVDPTPVDPTPVDPTPVDPTPVDPTPVDPTPVDPTPVDPTPVDPTPVDPTPVDPTPVDPTPVDPTPAIQGDDWLHCDGAKILDANGNQVYLTGANWFGFNCSERVFHGLWSANMKSVVEGMADHGINLVRVPISTELLLEWKAGKKIKVNINTHNNPELKNADGSDMDSRQIFDTFLALCKENGIKVMMDLHSLDANNSGHNYAVWYDVNGMTTEDWIEGWVWFVKEYRDDDTIIACDLKNEPHGKFSQGEEKRAKWDDSTDVNNWCYAASRCGKAILAVNPKMLIMVEGIEETPRPGYDFNAGLQSPNAGAEKKYYGDWWGGNLRNAEKYPVDLGIYQSQLVYSPHDYGPLVYEQEWFKKSFTKESLTEDVWYPNWFYLQDKNIAPLLIGEWGGFMDGDKNEQYLNYFAEFIAENKINHTFWCINPNSGDTGGLLEGDWATWDAKKYNMMKKTLWSDSRTGKFIGLDHQIPLGRTGESVSQYYGR